MGRQMKKEPDLAHLMALWPDLAEAGCKLLVTTAQTLAGQLQTRGKRRRRQPLDPLATELPRRRSLFASTVL
jgi:hypothetical protein